MKQTYFKEIFDYPINEFKEHLEWENNDRIILSGKYGMGKTKFLENFFSTENQNSLFSKEKFNVYKLFPTNYSIASNDDIIRYIKYDIIIEMLKQSISMDDVKLKLKDTLPSYIFKNLHKVTAALVYMIPKIGKEVVEAFEKIDKLKDEFLQYHNDVNKTSGDKLIEYLEHLEMKEGSIYENDITTKIISEVISENKEKESVLLIDDVDRLDPEHIFRILNVFASHFDSNSLAGTKNKFNFDKIIIVCDFNNIRNLFHHKYGLETDFIGYIDKFYSYDVYYFDNKKAIQSIISKVFSSLILQGSDPKQEGIFRGFYFNNEFIIGFLSLLLNSNLISLRNIIKIHTRTISHHSQILKFENHIEILAWRIGIVTQIKLIKDFFGDLYSMKRAILNLLNNNAESNRFDSYLGDLLYLLSYKEHRFNRSDPFIYHYKNLTLEIQPKLNFINEFLEHCSVYRVNPNQTSKEMSENKTRFYGGSKFFFETLLDCIDLLNSIYYLR